MRKRMLCAVLGGPCLWYFGLSAVLQDAESKATVGDSSQLRTWGCTREGSEKTRLFLGCSLQAFMLLSQHRMHPGLMQRALIVPWALAQTPWTNIQP